MRWFLLTSVFWFCAGAGGSVTAQAEPTEPVLIVSPPAPDQAPPAELAWEQQPRLDLERKAKRARIALWSTAAVFAAGLITFSVGLSECTELVSRTETRVVCSRAGEVLQPTGRALMLGGAVGALTSGIMLAVRNKRRRDHDRRARDVPEGGPADR